MTTLANTLARALVWVLALGYLFALAFLFSGCAHLEERGTAQRIAVQYAAMKYIGEDAGKAERVAAQVAVVRTLLEREEATVGALAAAVRERIDWTRLAPADRMLLAGLLDELEAELARRISAGVLEPEQRLRIARVLDWIAQAAALAAPR